MNLKRKGDREMALKEWKTITPEYRKKLKLTKQDFLDEFKEELYNIRKKVRR